MNQLQEKIALNKQTTRAFGKDIYLLGADAEGIKYWLEAPSWDCNHYWGFGYVETYTSNDAPGKSKDINSHEHISSFMGNQGRGKYVHNLFDNQRLTTKSFTENEGWELSELFNQFYFLKEAAENFERGKCYTSNAAIPLWRDSAKAKEINDTIIPQVTKRILEILSPSK